MDLPPKIYHSLIRPNWYHKKFTLNTLKDKCKFAGKTVLDFGCGIGSNCFLFKPENYLGVDVDKKRIDYAKNSNPKYNFQVINENINLASHSFDIILIIAVLHHIPNKKLSAIFKEFHRILKYPGKILVLEPCFFKKYLLNNFFMKLFDRGQHIRKHEDYLNIFKTHKFTIEHKEVVSKLAYKELFFSAYQS